MNDPDFEPPVAAVRPHAVASPFGTRTDPYYWLRDDERTQPDVLAYLNAENAYRERRMGARGRRCRGLRERGAGAGPVDDGRGRHGVVRADRGHGAGGERRCKREGAGAGGEFERTHDVQALTGEAALAGLAAGRGAITPDNALAEVSCDVSPTTCTVTVWPATSRVPAAS